MKEAVNNALKHSGATEINLSIQLEGGQLKISVTDNGIGLGRDAGCEGNGLGNIAERMAVIRGDCSMADVREGGLRVSLCVPLNPSIK